jgi:hypothetical protein
MFSILKDSVVSVQTYKSADNEALTGSGVDMKGFRSVAFIVGAAGGEDFSTWSVKAQQDTDSAFGTAADLLGTATAFATVASPSTDGVAVLEIREPTERYVRPVITVPNLSTAQVTFCIAIRYGADNLPTTNVTGELHVSPAEGTA